ncbi:MAG: hypothetical protein DLM57_00320 [Pseudonocardiales bacterium]|nr:MAG: hypothetical protein DLM57_00320 [Pseudonocardiales bacterium]
MSPGSIEPARPSTLTSTVSRDTHAFGRPRCADGRGARTDRRDLMWIIGLEHGNIRDRFGTGAITRAVLLGGDPGLTMPRLPD